MADNKIANAIKFLKGEEKSLPAAKTEGQVYFAYKNVGTAEKPSYTGAIYIDTPIGGTQNRIKMTANADIADKAFNDSAGLSIRDTYLSSLGYTDDGKQTILIKGSGNNQTRIALPIASTAKSGIVTTDAQSFGGTKTFTTINSTNLTVTGSSGFSYTGIETATESKARPIWFADSSGNGKPVINTNFTYNPATQTLSVANLSGTADKANKDNAGNDIRSTYISNITVNGTTLTFTKGSGAISSITLQDTNNAVTQTAIKSSDYTNWRTVLWGASNSATEGFAPTTVTDGTFTSDTLTFQPSSGTLKAKVFKGSLLGNASTATSATKATYDSSGTKDIRSYVSDVTISGRTITVTKGSGAKVTLTTQDTDTWRGIQNNLTSDSTTDSLSAAQGKYLKSLIDGKSNNGHNHDDRYYTETEINNKLANYLPLSGGTITGQIKRNAGGNWVADRDHAAVFNTLSGGDSYQPVVGQKTAAGSWTIGSLGLNESLVFNYCTDANYNAGNNTSEPIYLPAQAGTIITSATIGGQSVNYANSAGKLSTSRTISLTGSVTGSGNFDGSGNLTISTATSHTHNSVTDINSGATTTFAYSKAGMGYGDFTWLAAWNGSELRAVNKSLFATAGHTHSYLPLSGGTMNGTAFIEWADSGNWGNNNVTFPISRGGLQWNGQSDYVKLFSQETGQDNLELVLQFGDDNSNGLSIRNYAGNETARITASGGFTGTFYGNLSGKASTAGTADVANSVAWSNVSGKPGTFTPSSHTHTNIISRGRKNPCASGTTGNNANAEVNVAGLSLTEAYNESTPTSFGNIINVIGAGARGAGQLFLGWSGTDSVTEHLYYRSHRDVPTGGWGPWRTVAFTTDNVASADTLTSNAGSATQPIYFSGGKPVACSYSLSKSVPSNAVFTDTNTWRGCQNNLTSTATDQSLSAAQGKWLNENKLNAINTNGYWGMATPSGNSGDWIRTTSAGIIPYQPGGINSSHCGIGTSSWYFNYAYITTVYGNLSGNASTASKLATARTVSGGTDITMSFNYDGSGNSDANIGFYNCSAYVSNTNNYPFHRFAKLDVIPDSWADKTTTFYVSQDFNGGAFGIFRISLRTNNVSNNELASAEVVWLVRYGIPADAIQIGLYNVAGATYADAFIKTQGSYYSTVFRAIANGVRGTISRTWTLINSSENGNTSSSDKKGSYECYASVAAAGTALHNKSYTNIVSGFDVGNVSTASYASSAGNATQWNGRTLDIGTEAGSDAGWLLIDNDGIVRHRSASYFATAGHTHNYLPLSGGTMTGSIGYSGKGYCYIGTGTSDAANMVGGGLNNLVISSWQGISFTTTCSSTFNGKNAVSIDCRNGVLAAASLRVGNGSGSTINFCTNGGTANSGAKIVAYNDRIEFVFG